jgi:hypothetical protein
MGRRRCHAELSFREADTSNSMDLDALSFVCLLVIAAGTARIILLFGDLLADWLA